ncbi:hypothetical protein [Polaromonas sp.]|uniref:hypothetical protein n=1 Tax=Polaromonas sp. TaxID=1869339 RepID=UPI0035671D90
MATPNKSQQSKVVAINPSAQATEQLPLLPLRVAASVASPFPTADLKTIVRTLDHHFYALKSVTEHPLLPATEFLCYRLASACGLPVPYSAIIEVEPNGELAFGSRFEGGVVGQKAVGTGDQLQMFKDCADPISAILALDVFVGNEDRHRGNFLFRKNYQDSWVPVAIDYSRALFVRGFPDDSFPISPNCNTRNTINVLKRTEIWNGPFAVFALDSLRNVQRANISHWLNEMPAAWLPPPVKSRLVDWWQSTEFHQRIEKVYESI